MFLFSHWRKFYALKQELTSRRYSLSDRLRLCEGVVTPTLLYGCEAWTMTTEIENRLRRTQRHMLRMIFQTPRRIIKQPQHMVNSAREAQSNTPQSPRSEGTAETGSSHGIDSTASPIPEKLPVDDEEDNVLEPWHIWI